MKTRLQFLTGEDRRPSDCGDPLVIEESSRDLGWKGVLLEKGWSPHFYPTDIVTPYFYFALALDRDLNWQVENEGKLKALKTVPGDIWINPPWTPFTHQIDEACFFTILAVDEQFMYDSFGAGASPAGTQFLNNYNLDDAYLKNLIELLYFEVRNKGVNGPRFVADLMRVFCRYFMEHYSSALSTENDSRISGEQVRAVEQYIRENISEPILIEELAAEVNLSKFYFLKEFKKAVGRTPYKFLMDIRMEEAARRLENSDQDLASIAYGLGFTDQSHFTRAFKQHYDISPGKYRKQPGDAART